MNYYVLLGHREPVCSVLPVYSLLFLFETGGSFRQTVLSANPAQRSSHAGLPVYIGWNSIHPTYLVRRAGKATPLSWLSLAKSKTPVSGFVFQMQHVRTRSESLYRRKKLERHRYLKTFETCSGTYSI
jgi:hypothetical protein